MKYSKLTQLSKYGKGIGRQKNDAVVIAEFKIALNKILTVKVFKGKIYLDLRKYERGHPTKAGITLNEFEFDKFLDQLEKIIKAIYSASKLKTDTDPPAEIFMFDDDDDDVDDNNDNDIDVDENLKGIVNGPSTSKKRKVVDKECESD